MAQRLSQKPVLYAICLAIISMALSISATHIFVALSFLLFLYDFLREFPKKPSIAKAASQENFWKKINRNFQEAWLQNRLLLLGGLYYLWLLVSSLLRFGTDWGLLKRAFSSEISDFALYLFGLLIFAVSRKDQDSRRLLDMAFRIMAVLFVLSGLVALFSEFRLGRLLSGHGFVASAQNRPQHKLIELWGWQLYRPVGFMNTHLTFGGLLLLSFPLLFSDLLEKVKNKAFRAKNKIILSKKQLQFTFVFLFLGCGLLLLLANGARSVILGALLFYPPLLLSLFGIRLFSLWRSLLAAGSLCLILLAAGLFYANKSGSLKKESPVSVAKKSPLFSFARLQEGLRPTDYTRPVIWQSSWEIFLAHPLFGVGSGAFFDVTWKWRNRYMQGHPRMLYFFKNTPDGHAHNDLLHIAVVSGLPGVIFFLALIYFTGKELIQSNSIPAGRERRLFVSYGLAAFFVAGLFQCYFQDDEVVILFWALIGRYLGNFSESQSNQADCAAGPS